MVQQTTILLSILVATAAAGGGTSNDPKPVWGSSATVWQAHSMFVSQFTQSTNIGGLDFWIRANAWQSIFDYYASFGNKDGYLAYRLESFKGYDFRGEGNAFNDDRLWLALAAIRAFDLSSNPDFMEHAKFVHAHVKKTWNDKCGGGVQWKTDNNYKNTITNVLFYQLSISIFKRTNGEQQYLLDGHATYEWLMKTGLYDGKVFQDGLNGDSCQVQSGIYSYQLGPLMAGLVEEGQTAKALEFAINSLPSFTTANVIREYDSCDLDATKTDGCGGDGAVFKGVYTRGLGKVLAAVGATSPEAGPIAAALQTSLTSLRDRDLIALPSSRVKFGISWTGPSLRQDERAQIIAMDLYNANSPFAPPVLACTFTDLNFGGTAQCFRDAGYYDVSMNDQISSLNVKAGCIVKAASDGGMQGKTKDFTGSVGWIGDELNDQISSLTITCQ